MILDMYRLGKLHVTDTGCPLVMESSLEYWALDELLIQSCCSLKYYPQLDVCQNEKLGDIQAKITAEQKINEENFGNSRFGRFRSQIWDTIEYPWKNSSAQLLGILLQPDCILLNVNIDPLIRGPLIKKSLTRPVWSVVYEL